MSTEHDYRPALSHRVLTPLYDPLMRWTMRESTFRTRLVAQADVQPRSRVLDLGCGTGTLTILLQQAVPEAEVIGIDADPDVLEIARRKAESAGTVLRLAQGDATALPYADGSFDRVVTSLLFHHLAAEAKRSVAREVFRVLRRGGSLHVADWGRPQNVLMRLAFVAVQLLDGFATTGENVAGVLPRVFQGAGFDPVVEQGHLATAFGTLSLYRAEKPATAGVAAPRGF